MAIQRVDFATLVRDFTAQGGLTAVAANARAQFGTPNRTYVGLSRFLPERLVPENRYTERAINLLTIIANAGPRYGPAQLKQGGIGATFEVSMGHSDIARELDSQDLDAIREYLGRRQTLPALAVLTNFTDALLNRALVEHNERNVWDAIVDSQVTLRGDGGYEVVVDYMDPDGHRMDAGGDWTDPAYDPMPDIMAVKRAAAAKGRVIAEIWTSGEVAATILGNAQMLQRTGNAIIQNVGGTPTFQILQTQATQDAVDNVFRANGLPPIQTYDLTYRVQADQADATGGSRFFLKRNAMVFICRQDQATEVQLDDAGETAVLPNALGYTAIGTPAGAAGPGRMLFVEYKSDKAPRIQGQSWQASSPVITQPEDIFVIRNINTGA